MVSRQSSGAEGVDVFVLRGLDGIEHGLAEVGEGGGGFALYASLGHAGEDVAESGAEIAGGKVTAGEQSGNIAADGLGGLGLCFLTGMKTAETRMAGKARSAAFAAIGKGERTQGRAVLGAKGRHGCLQKVKDLSCRGVSRKARRTTEQEYCARTVRHLSRTNLVHI